MNSQQFLAELERLSLPDVFNPYRDRCDEFDHAESSAMRQSNLQRYLSTALATGVDSVWLGRDCGYRGGRRTGVALTDELQLATLEHHFGIVGLAKATIGPAMKERTATQVWKSIREVRAKVFLWNIFPFHPFELGNPMSNRRHTQREFNACKDLLVCLLELLQPKKIVALGADAHKAVVGLGFDAAPARHPSYGGHLEFAATIRRLYGVPATS